MKTCVSVLDVVVSDRHAVLHRDIEPLVAEAVHIMVTRMCILNRFRRSPRDPGFILTEIRFLSDFFDRAAGGDAGAVGRGGSGLHPLKKGCRFHKRHAKREHPREALPYEAPPSRLNAGQLTIPVGNSRMTKTNLDLPDIGQMSNGSLSMVKT